MYDTTLNDRYQEPGETLRDEQFPWKERKMRANKLAKIYQAAGYEEYAERARTCATWLQYWAQSSGERQLIGANFCQLRLCPLCTARRAKRMAYKLSQVLSLVQGQHPGTTYLFLTLTVRNCAGDALGAALTQLTGAWDRLCRHRPIQRAVMGWFRAIEITRHGDSYHPHIHAIVAVEPAYFKRSNGLYLTHDQWVQRWRLALRVDYDPSVRIAKTKAKEGGKDAETAAAVEAAKYATKDSDYIDPRLTMEEAVEIVTVYTRALHRRRLTAYGGWLKEAARALDAEDLEDGDLVHIEPDKLREDVAELIEEYHWSFGAGDYILADRRVNPLRVVKGDS